MRSGNVALVGILANSPMGATRHQPTPDVWAHIGRKWVLFEH